jgi:hypothetical protein
MLLLRIAGKATPPKTANAASLYGNRQDHERLLLAGSRHSEIIVLKVVNFRFLPDSGHRKIANFKAVYSCYRPTAAIQTITNALPRRALNGQKRTSDE